MKIAVQQGTRKLAIREAPRPKAGPGQVLIKIAYCGVCGSDLHFFAHEHAPSGNVLGHEWSGEIVEVGEGVTNFKAGDCVTMANIPVWLTQGQPPKQPIAEADLLRLHPVAHAGGFAEYLLYYAHAVHHLPDGVSLEEGALTDTLGVGVTALNRIRVHLGDSVLIIGAGPIGLTTLICARLAGAGRVVVSEIAEVRKQAAKRFGADVVLDPSEVDLAAEVLKLTGGAGMAPP